MHINPISVHHIFPPCSPEINYTVDLQPPQLLITLPTSSRLFDSRSQYSIQQRPLTTPSFVLSVGSFSAFETSSSAYSLNSRLDDQASSHGILIPSREPVRVLSCDFEFPVSVHFPVITLQQFLVSRSSKRRLVE